MSVRIPSSSMGTPTSRALADRKTCSAPKYDGSSTTTVSPGSTSARAAKSSPCWEPDRISTSAGLHGIPRAASQPASVSRSAESPSVGQWSMSAGPVSEVSSPRIEVK